jgi:excisionase family DNA binding protein
MDRRVQIRKSGEPEMVPIERMLLRAGEAAEMLGVGRSTIYELANRGLIPTIRVGQALRFPRQQLVQWIDKQLEETHPQNALRRNTSS